MFKRIMPALIASAFALMAKPIPQAMPQAMPQPGAFASARNERGSRSPIHPKRGTPPKKHRGHAKRRGARAARRRARLARRG